MLFMLKISCTSLQRFRSVLVNFIIFAADSVKQWLVLRIFGELDVQPDLLLAYKQNRKRLLCSEV